MPRATSSVLSVIATIVSTPSRRAHRFAQLWRGRSVPTEVERWAACRHIQCRVRGAGGVGALSLGGDTWGYAPAAALFNSFARVLNVTASFH
jgi:hypothetical protein